MEETPDFSKAVENLQEMLASDDGQSQIQNLLGMFASGSGEDSQSGQEQNAPLNLSGLFGNSEGIDIGTIMKIQGIMSAMNSSHGSPQAEFLNSLKPFLKKSRRQKLDQATQIIKMTTVLKAFKESSEGGV